MACSQAKILRKQCRGKIQQVSASSQVLDLKYFQDFSNFILCNIRAYILELEAKIHFHTLTCTHSQNLCSPVKQHRLHLGSQDAAVRIQSGLYKQLPLIAVGFLVLKKADACITQFLNSSLQDVLNAFNKRE